MAFQVQTEHFQGPFGLLLDLIEQRKLLVNEISLAKVTDDFIAYIDSQENFPMGEGASFILVAATLLLIKSRSLLPTLELTTEEQGDIKSLELRLALYKKIRELAGDLQNNFGKTKIFAPAKRDFMETVFSPNGVNLEMVRVALGRVLEQIKRPEVLPRVVVKKIISLEEMIERLAKRVENGLKMNFRDFTNAQKDDKINVIVGFLAMLELVRRGMIRAEQEGSFGDIDIETQNMGVPNYS